MAIYDDKWFEVWYSEGKDVIPNYLLIVTFDKRSEEVIVLDPSNSNKSAFRAKNYEDVRSWLSADEFELVEGRVFPDDGY